MGAGTSGLHAALPKSSSAERAGKLCELWCVGNTACSALAQAGLMETIDSGFPCLPFSVLLGYLGQHRAPIRLFHILLEAVFYSVWVKVSCVETCQEGIWST